MADDRKRKRPAGEKTDGEKPGRVKILGNSEYKCKRKHLLFAKECDIIKQVERSIVRKVYGVRAARGFYHKKQLNKEKKMTVKDLSAEEKLRLICGKGIWTTEDFDGKIPNVWMSDGPVGLRKSELDADGNWVRDYPSIAYPALQCLANSWSRECAREMGEALADDCKENDVDILLAPGVNIKRNPLNGRNFEYFSEDPVLAGTLAKEYIEGLQSKGVGACLKHYYVNNLEYNRLDQSSEVDERSLREIYLKPFEIACRAKPVSVMCAYNRINGVYASENKKGFDILRNEFGFDGAVISDWGAVHDRVKAAKAGLDLEMPFCKRTYEKLLEDYRAGKISEAEIDVCAERVLELVRRCKEMGKDQKVERTTEERFGVAKKIAEEGMVLLKNDGVLPIRKGAKVLVGGEFAAPGRIGHVSGAGSAMVQWKGERFDLAKILDGKLGGGVRFSRLFWEQSVSPEARDGMNAALESDVCVVCVGTGTVFEGEGWDRREMCLPKCQEEMILQIASLNPNTVVVIFAGGAVDVSAWQDSVAGILLAGFCGERGGEALAEILAGEVNPSGKLSETFPLCLEDTPSYGTLNTPLVSRYGEGLDVGYRYYDSCGIPVAFPFGHGLSYSDFEYYGLKAAAKGEQVKVSFSLKNVSACDGKEVCQLYIRPLNAYVYRPEQELKAFAKQEVKAGKTVKAAFTLTAADFAYYSTAKDGWTTDDGFYEIRVGASSRDIRLKALIKIADGKFEFVKEVPVVER